MVVRVEAEVHGAEGKRVEGQTREVVGDHDGRVGPVARPLEGKLSRNLVHLVEHALDGRGAKRRHQHPVRNAPVWLVPERREEAIVDAVPDLAQG